MGVTAGLGVAPPRPVVETSPLIDQILDEHRAYANGDHEGWTGYRNHAQRVFVFGSQLIEPRADALEQLAIAAAFHDLAVFRTVDYLVPNARAMRAWLAGKGHPQWVHDITWAMTMHHRIRAYHGPESWLVEPLRRADWVECTAWRWHPGIDRALIRQARRELPMGRRFTCTSALRIATRAVTHPLDPFPFARSERALRDLRVGAAGEPRDTLGSSASMEAGPWES